MASEVSRNLQADKYISNSGWEKFTGPFLSWAPRTTLASLSRARIKADKTVSYFRRRKQGSFSWWRAAYFETSLSNSKVFSRRVNMRILNGGKKEKQSVEKIEMINYFWMYPVFRKRHGRKGAYQLCDHDWPERCEVLRRDAQQKNSKHQEDLGGDGRAGIHT